MALQATDGDEDAIRYRHKSTTSLSRFGRFATVTEPRPQGSVKRPCGAANPGRSRLSRRLDPLESESAGRIARPT